jgi:hypothetical protein
MVGPLTRCGDHMTRSLGAGKKQHYYRYLLASSWSHPDMVRVLGRPPNFMTWCETASCHTCTIIVPLCCCIAIASLQDISSASSSDSMPWSSCQALTLSLFGMLSGQLHVSLHPVLVDHLPACASLLEKRALSLCSSLSCVTIDYLSLTQRGEFRWLHAGEQYLALSPSGPDELH